jgi:hypothetical protein
VLTVEADRGLPINGDQHACGYTLEQALITVAEAK